MPRGGPLRSLPLSCASKNRKFLPISSFTFQSLMLHLPTPQAPPLPLLPLPLLPLPLLPLPLLPLPLLPLPLPLLLPVDPCDWAVSTHSRRLH